MNRHINFANFATLKVKRVTDEEIQWGYMTALLLGYHITNWHGLYSIIAPDGKSVVLEGGNKLTLRHIMVRRDLKTRYGLEYPRDDKRG